MDKNEFREKTEQMLACIKNKEYQQALEIVESIEWKKIKNVAALCMASEVYECCGEYEKSRSLLMDAYERSPESRKIVYRLGVLALKADDVTEATNCYEEFLKLAPKDPNGLILRYRILRKQGAPLQEQIAALEEFKKVEYVEKWAFELAKLYQEAGMTAECLEECDDLILWFSEGKFVYKAMELKMEYKPLTPLQQEKYEEYKNPKQEEAEVVAAEPETTVEESAPAEEEASSEVEEAITEELVAETEEPESAMEEPISEAEEPEATPEEAVAEEPVTEEPEPEVAEGPATAETKEDVEEVPTEESSEEEEPIEIEEEEPVVVKSPTSGLSVQEILQDWEEKQKENAQMILAEQERLQKEQEAEEKEQDTEEAESVLPDDILKLMQELESESEEIKAQRAAQAPPQPKKFATGHLPDLTGVASAVGAVVSGAIHANAAAEKVAEQATETVAGAGAAAASKVVETVAEEAAETVQKVVEPEKGIKVGDTQEIMNAAKALMNDEVIEVSDEEIPELKRQSRSKYDTGFVVQGRYDLEAQSEIGLKAGLTEEQKKLFSYFVPVHGMSEQLVDVIEKDKKCRARYGTSRTGNLLVVGRKGSGKTVLAVNIVKAIQKSRKVKHGKLAIVTAEALNKKELSPIVDKLHGGAVVIEHASRLNKRTISQLNDLMEEQTGELLVVLEDERKQLDRMLESNSRFQKKFTSRVELPVFINDELVTFGQTYAKENGYRIDEMGILALYSHIDMLQREEAVVTVADVKEIIDAAIEHSCKFNMKKLAKKLFGKAKDESARVLLTEEDFKL